jgi:hypothetical protein
MLQSNEKSISKLFSSGFMPFIFIRLAGTGSVLPVEKTTNGSCVLHPQRRCEARTLSCTVSAYRAILAICRPVVEGNSSFTA